MDNKICISWIDLTLELKSGLFSQKKIILSNLNGSAMFGTVTAVMGPSGAGLTSLLKCLNGMNYSNFSKESKIRLNSVHKIRSTFVGHNEKEFLIMGLTAKQNMIYASKLKNSNCGQDVDHQRNVSQIMSDLLISDIINTKAQNCSGGEQKRLAIALELTALNKPNLILCDEPTTGLDSNVAEVVIMCLKELALKNRISIITTIHQPSSDILQIFDNLYVLAKGGVCVYSGTPQYLPKYLRDFDIICNENQVPIETLVTICAKGRENSKVIELMSKSTQEVKQWIGRHLSETNEKRIKEKKKKFCLIDIYLLMKRKLIEFISYGYQLKAFYLFTLIMLSISYSLLLNPEAKHNDDCIYLNQTNEKNCIEMLDSESKINKNMISFLMTLWLLILFQCIVSIAQKIIILNIFTNEHQNKWYSSGVYYLTETIWDFIWVTTGSLIASLIIFTLTEQKMAAKRFLPFLYVYQLAFHAIDGYAHLVAIILFKSKEICFIVGLLYSLSNSIFVSFYVPFKDMTHFFQIISNISIIKFGLDSLLIITYGFDRCLSTQVSKLLIQSHINDDDLFWENTSYIWIQILLFRGLSLLSLLLIKNSIFETICQQMSTKFRKIKANNEIEMQTIARRIPECYDNQIDVNISDEMSFAFDLGDCHTSADILEKREQSNSLSIGWVDMTLKIEKTFYANEKLILRGVMGFIQFNTLTALMGPSGAGKTSLLKCLNGFYRNLITKESKIYLNSRRKIRTCFIAQDQREHIINGLTVKQSIIYASKLKNCGKDVDHQIKVTLLMEELAITDIKDNIIQKCSSGQQKRVVMAMELTPEVKPNLICVDEPTSGVDSYSALLMIRCFKNMAQKHNLSIITSIHQPNLEVFMIFDLIYVLAKGGLCVYSGGPQNLRTHLLECQIICRETQIPIELLLKIGANGYMDETVVKLSEKTSQELITFQKRAQNECRLYRDGIPIRSKSFSLQQMWNLLIRLVLYTFRYDWTQLCFQFSVYLISAIFFINYFDFHLERPTSCEPISTNSCLVTIDTIEESQLLGFNKGYLLFASFSLACYAMVFTSQSFSREIKVFYVEYRNYWYSTESYFLAKLLFDLLTNLIFVFSYTAIITTVYDKEDTFSTFLLAFCLMFMSFQSIGHIFGALLVDNAVVGSIAIVPFIPMFNGMEGLTDKDLDVFFARLSNLNPLKACTQHTLAHLYKDRCSAHQISSLMYKYDLDDDTFDKTLHILWSQLCLYRVLSYICLKVAVNWDSILIKIKNIKLKLFKTV